MGALADAVTGVFDAVGLKSWADNTFRGATIIAVETSVSRMYKPSLLIDPIKQSIIQSSLSKRNVAQDIKQLVLQNNNLAIKKAWDYGLGVYNSAELQEYYAEVRAWMSEHDQALVEYYNSIQEVLNSTLYHQKVAKKSSIDIKQAEYNNLVSINLAQKEQLQQQFKALDTIKTRNTLEE